MNFYKHHLGDYDGATAHLTWIEDMAYTRLLRAYYRREQGFMNTTEACRLVRALSKIEKQAVAVILTEFFSQESDGWHNKRADEEIAAYQAQAATNRRIARERIVHRTDSESSTNRTTKGTPSHKPEAISHKPEGSNGGWWKTDKGIEATAKTLALKIGPLETYAELKDRCFSEIEKRKNQSERAAA